MQPSNVDPVQCSPYPRMPEVGDVLVQRYRLDGESGRTEAGMVFEGTDLTLQCRVAIEIASSLEEPRARRKWAHDAMQAQRLTGEHVLRVLDVGNLDSGVPFVVREPALGTLGAELASHGALPVPKAVAWTLDACEALAEAHALGMAHGDMRLDNIYLASGDAEPTVKVAWTSAAKAERAAKEDVARDIAGLGAMLRILASGRMDQEADGATTLPTDVAHAVARALNEDPDGAFQNVGELARMLAPFAPPGHGSARNVALLFSRAGIVGRGVLAAPSSARVAAAATADESGSRVYDRASFTDEWFGKHHRTPVLGHDAPPLRSTARGTAFAVVSLALIAAVLGGSWLLWQRGELPRWTGAAPSEEVGTTQVTSAPAAADDANANANATAPASTPVESLPDAPAAATAASEPDAPTPPAIEAAKPAAAAVAAVPAPAAAPVARTSPAPKAPKPSQTTPGLRYTDPTETVPAITDESVPTPSSTSAPAEDSTSAPAPAEPIIDPSAGY